MLFRSYDEAREILECDLSEDVHDFIDNYWREYAIEAGLSAEESSNDGQCCKSEQCGGSEICACLSL